MQTSYEWYRHFRHNLTLERINWARPPQLTPAEHQTIVRSLQAWQLGETSDGSNLIKAATRYAAKIRDPFYVKAVELFIKEEQKHGENLGKYLDAIGAERIRKDWGDSLFRWFRYFNNNMEIWTLTVLTVESAAQLFYQSLKDATGCPLLKAICTDILIDEAPHIRFQQERMAVIIGHRKAWLRQPAMYVYQAFYLATALVVWAGHRRVFKAGGNPLPDFMRKMRFKFRRNFARFLMQHTSSATILPLTQPTLL